MIEITRDGSKYYEINLYKNGGVINYRSIRSLQEIKTAVSFCDVISVIVSFYPKYGSIQLGNEIESNSNTEEIKALKGLINLLDNLQAEQIKLTQKINNARDALD